MVWGLVEMVPGSGNSNVLKNYEIFHWVFDMRVRYYFLRQVDYNDKYKSW